jgi:hypothetical protein
MNQWKYGVFLALILSLFVVTGAAPLRAAKSDWNNLQTLKPGQQIRVVLSDTKLYQGELQALNDEGITLRQAAGERTFARNDILRIDAYHGFKTHLVRNILIGAAIGGALATPLILANNNNGWWRSSAWVAAVFVLGGAGIGAAVTKAGWHEVYRAHRHRQTATAKEAPMPRIDNAAPSPARGLAGP